VPKIRPRLGDNPLHLVFVSNIFSPIYSVMPPDITGCPRETNGFLIQNTITTKFRIVVIAFKSTKSLNQFYVQSILFLKYAIFNIINISDRSRGSRQRKNCQKMLRRLQHIDVRNPNKMK
jgi:hypothetical protein